METGDLLKVWKRSKKHRGWSNQKDITADLRDFMVRFAPVPRGMAEELAEYFLAEPVDEESIHKSQEILELLGGSWIPKDSILGDDAWKFLEEQVNAWAGDMDMDVVTHVMRAVLHHGDFHY